MLNQIFENLRPTTINNKFWVFEKAIFRHLFEDCPDALILQAKKKIPLGRGLKKKLFMATRRV